MKNFNYEYLVSSKNWKRNLLSRNLDLFVDFMVLPQMENEINPSEDNEIEIKIKLKKKEEE